LYKLSTVFTVGIFTAVENQLNLRRHSGSPALQRGGHRLISSHRCSVDTEASRTYMALRQTINVFAINKNSASEEAKKNINRVFANDGHIH